MVNLRESFCFVIVIVKIRNIGCNFSWGLCNLEVLLFFFKMKMPAFRGGVERAYSAIVDNTDF